MVFRFPSGLLPRPAPGSGPFPSASPCPHPPSTNGGPRGGVSSPPGRTVPVPFSGAASARTGGGDGTATGTVPSWRPFNGFAPAQGTSRRHAGSIPLWRISASAAGPSFPPRRTRGVSCRRLCLNGKPNEMQNDAGEFVDLYVPRKCSASNRIIGAKDHASIQINISEVDKVTGRVNGQFKTYAICGAIRRMGESDDSILRLAKNDGIVSKNF
uniref:Small ribosomal subunit protein eS21 n=1 Tax=Accipiter nisus TaxID=211598 RepID=A0A8B9M9T8_9AVES